MIELGLERIQQLLARTPLKWRAIHVAGTNGKGTVCGYVSAMLTHYNQSLLREYTGHCPLVHARFNSPHLIDRWDCVTVENKTIDKDKFDLVEKNVTKRNTDRGIKASSFEILTATVYELFNDQGVDIGVIEVGMGGRLDATNVLGDMTDVITTDDKNMTTSEPRPALLVTTITSIGMDHEAFLGNTLSKIAAEKAGIMKASVPVIAAKGTPEVCSTFSEAARAVNASELIVLSNLTTMDDICKLNNLKPPKSQRSCIPIQSRWPNGAIAVQTAWTALRRLNRLDTAPVEMQVELLAQFCEICNTTKCEGRLQMIDLSVLAKTDQSALALLDGAHNPQSAQILRQYLDEEICKPIQWIVAASQGKAIDEMLKIFLRPGDAIGLVEFGPVDGMPWVKAMKSEVIARAASSWLMSTSSNEHIEVKDFGSNLTKAIQHSFESAKQNDRQVVVSGSLYLVGDVLRMLRDRAAET